MATGHNDKIREVIATRIMADYATQGGTFALKFPNRSEPRNINVADDEGYIAVTWRQGTTLGSSFYRKSQRTPIILFCQFFIEKDAGAKIALDEADKMADAIRGQTWTVIAETPTNALVGRSVDGANPMDAIVTSNIRWTDPTVDLIGADAGGHWYQINLSVEGTITAKFGAIV